MELDDVYAERNALVAALSKLWPSHLALHPISDETWDPDWLNIVYVESPVGQLSWHIHKRELSMFAHLDFGPNDWDGHTSAEKYKRLEKLTRFGILRNIANVASKGRVEGLMAAADECRAQADATDESSESRAYAEMADHLIVVAETKLLRLRSRPRPATPPKQESFPAEGGLAASRVPRDKSHLSRQRREGPFAAQASRLVILESPYAGAVTENVEYARACLRDCLLRGEAPIASHLLYTQPGVLDDTIPAERALGIEAGLCWGKLAQATVVYTDRGISPGMRLGIERAKSEGREVEMRKLKATITVEGSFKIGEEIEHIEVLDHQSGDCGGLNRCRICRAELLCSPPVEKTEGEHPTQNIVRGLGCCGALVLGGSHVCILPVGHSDSHPE